MIFLLFVAYFVGIFTFSIAGITTQPKLSKRQIARISLLWPAYLFSLFLPAKQLKSKEDPYFLDAMKEVEAFLAPYTTEEPEEMTIEQEIKKRRLKKADEARKELAAIKYSNHNSDVWK